MVDIINWENASTTAADNLAVAGVSDAEGWLPSTVNNFTRASWAVLAKFWDEYGGVVTVAGTADAITITTPGTHTALSTGLRFLFKAGSTNTTAATLNLDAIGAKAIRKMSGGTDVALVAGDILAGRRYEVLYDATANSAAGAWILIGGESRLPGVTTDNAIPRFDGTTGHLQNSVVTIADTTGNMAFPTNAILDFGSGGGNGFITAFSFTYSFSDNGASQGPEVYLRRSSTSPATADALGFLIFQGNDSGAATQNYGGIRAVITDPTAASEDGLLEFYRVAGGTFEAGATLGGGLYMKGTTDPGAGGIAATSVYIDATGSAVLTLDKGAATDLNFIQGRTAGSLRWDVALGNNTAESGANAGSDFTIGRYSDAGSLIGTAFYIERATGLIELSSGQLRFPATQNPSSGANTLDDYEEGTTTPTPTAASGTFTTVAATLSYTKVGNRVAWNATITITTNGTAAGRVILPLPFTNGSQAAGVCGVRTDSGVAVAGRVAASGTNADIWLFDGTYPGATGATIVCGGTFNV